MTVDRESNQDEQRPLLLPPEAGSSRDEASSDAGNKPAFFLALALITLFQAGLAAPVVSATSLMENILCQRQHGSLRDCKSEDVQSKLAMVKGIASLTFFIPGKVGGRDRPVWSDRLKLVLGIFLTVPFGALADRYGTRPIMAVAITGIFLREICSDLVCAS